MNRWIGLGLAAALAALPMVASGQSLLDQLEGTAGHAPPSPGLSALEGTHGHEPAAPEEPILCAEGQVCIEEATQLPLRVLPRPFSHVYADRNADPAGIRIANVPSFHPLYVFERQDLDLSDAADPAGWYRVGRTRAEADGWMQARDVLEWRQALLVSYTHPGGPIEGRNPVLMFRDYRDLAGLVDDFDMAGRARALYRAIDDGDAPEQVVSMEPQRFVDITRQFYVLPILEWEQTQIDGDDARLLQIAAAVPGARGADTLDAAEYREQARVARVDGAAERRSDLQADIVFVIDTTRSMQPFIDMTRDAVASTAARFRRMTDDRVRFGLVTFRDSIEVIPQLEYDTRNWTPELVDSATLAERLEDEVRATEVGSLDYAEEVFAGVDTALQSQWRDGALRFMILIGDASSHPKGHPQNITGKDEIDLRRELDDAQVHLHAIHLLDPRATEDHPIAEPQFRHLARIRGSRDESAYDSVDAFDDRAFYGLIDSVANGLIERLATTAGEHEPVADEELPPLETLTTVDRLWEAALVEYLGRSANPPKDIVAWVLDRDLVHPVDRALDVRVLVTREQLSSLAQALDQVVQALMRAEVTQAQFFEALQSVSGQAMKRPEDLGQARDLAGTGLLPAFIQSLPYRSDILSLNDEMFASMTTEQRSQLEWSILAKLEQYRAINEQVDAWFRMNDADRDRDMVYPLHLDYLP
ncbi:Serine/threonine protein kinase PpkA [Thioalkalivibrio nitratireducens DSM 14787]|uniref:Serine/threonine protein kinase PpkA n=1 Tax=Thioalkalivibrio nitratireducens (strain DSM 14787 / UNIQEM 213 / ALEN2) TaxID=1255043 RepID=L0DX47_THIND|nr:vWA domain-containing protein [Thioalkalivibrio nitratireducens]AGA34179.1 Serine/threonine protein kinase PpkA [Thioalkalivibrio nitratireducens DSM 14787]